MDWIFEHFKLIIVIGGGIAYWLAQRKKAQEEAEAERRLASKPAPQAQRPVDDEAERVRRIQEEIRRKILERAGGGGARQAPPVLQQPAQVVVPSPLQQKAAARPDAYSQETEPARKTLDESILERQQELAEKMRELEESRRHVAGKAEMFTEKTALAMSAADRAPRGSLLADLRSPEAARRAIVMREILGTPVGLR